MKVLPAILEIQKLLGKFAEQLLFNFFADLLCQIMIRIILQYQENNPSLALIKDNQLTISILPYQQYLLWLLIEVYGLTVGVI